MNFEMFLNLILKKNDFRNYLENVISNGNQKISKITANIRKAKNIVNTAAVSSAEAERGFPLMNIIIADIKAKLTIKAVSILMSLNLIGRPLETRNAIS